MGYQTRHLFVMQALHILSQSPSLAHASRRRDMDVSTASKNAPRAHVNRDRTHNFSLSSYTSSSCSASGLVPPPAYCFFSLNVLGFPFLRHPPFLLSFPDSGAPVCATSFSPCQQTSASMHIPHTWKYCAVPAFGALGT